MVEARGKHLTIKEAKNELQKDMNELELYLTKKKINYQKTQPKGTNYDKIVVSGIPISFDKFTHYVIKDEQYDSKIYSLEASINAWQEYIRSELERLSNYDELGLIVYLREELEFNWNQIDRLLHHSLGTSKVKYSRYKNLQKNCK